MQAYTHTPARCEELECVHRFNNFVKAALISTFFKPHGWVLDMPCGRGGDLKKFRESKASFYVGIDIVPEQIEEAQRRFKATKCMFGAIFEVADFTKPLSLESRYDLVSCQFAYHYAWNCKESAQQVLRTAMERLTAGGSFVMTFPDWDTIVQRLFNEKTVEKTEKGDFIYRIGNRWHYLEFTSPHEFGEFMQNLQTEPFGQQYIYYQQGAIERVPEYMIEPNAFESLCREEGLRIVYDKNFLEFEGDPFGKNLNVLRGAMGVTNVRDEDKRALIGLYRAVVLQTKHKRFKK
jgi:mRNA (guanine-N7-)-methyltransferase